MTAAEFESKGRYDYDLTPDSVVIDAGGYDGDYADAIFKRHGCRVLVFEPILAHVGKIRRRFDGNDKILVFNYGLYDASSTWSKFIVKGNMTGQWADAGVAEMVSLATVKDVMDAYKVERVDLLKLNIEGSEFAVLEQMLKDGIMDKFKDIAIQWHDVAPDAQKRYDSLQKELAKTHHLTFDNGWIWQNWRINAEASHGAMLKQFQ